ncbi:CLUMA_CG000487, isoform A [Clunio marinus]|uniref:CLUMA_CG000487, isoform A n=1 Tax=Clunio marinus TaxID=568069 RepID=A0A1J1HFM2_9DIPT|nr:CLUMA_CG000487, isoform A [Clunio marinus]
MSCKRSNNICTHDDDDALKCNGIYSYYISHLCLGLIFRLISKQPQIDETLFDLVSASKITKVQIFYDIAFPYVAQKALKSR